MKARLPRWLAAVGLTLLCAFGPGCAIHFVRPEDGPKDLLATVQADASLKAFAHLISAANMADALTGNGPMTVLAPTDKAFGALPAGALPNDKAALTKLLSRHVLQGKILAFGLPLMGPIKTLGREELVFTEKDGVVGVRGARLTKTDILCTNGVIHVIDAALTAE